MIDIIDNEISDILKDLHNNLTDKVLIRNSVEDKDNSKNNNKILIFR